MILRSAFLLKNFNFRQKIESFSVVFDIRDCIVMSIMECNKETIEVLYNSIYGGYELSDKTKKMFEERKTNEDNEDDRDTPLILQ